MKCARTIGLTWFAAIVMIGARTANAQPPDDLQIQYNSGASVVPVFEGWERNADGSFDFVFGYLNRNYTEQVVAPVGPFNNIEPGGPDRGQPAYFYPRVNRFIFRVKVPSDWGTKQLVWTLTVHGKTEKALGSLKPTWEINRLVEASNGGGTGGDEMAAKNQPPAVTIQPVRPVILPTPLTLTASVTDDGLPPPRARRQREPSGPSGPPLPTNVPIPANRGADRPLPLPQGLTVAWIVYRGPGMVRFDPEGFTNVKDGMSTVRATFSEPGTYVIRADASDGMLRSPADVTVEVTTSDSSRVR